jgi:hypothetical protein
VRVERRRARCTCVGEAKQVHPFDTALADAGYDAEHNHRLCRDGLGMRQAVIALNPRNAASGHPRRLPAARCITTSRPRSTTSAGTPGAPLVSTSAGTALTARAEDAQRRELVLRVLTHNLALLARAG